MVLEKELDMVLLQEKDMVLEQEPDIGHFLYITNHKKYCLSHGAQRAPFSSPKGDRPSARARKRARSA